MKDIFLEISGNTVRNEALYKYFVMALHMANIDSTYGKAAFLAQILGETKMFKAIESTVLENDNNPSIGNTEKGDGTKYRGRGAILIRGKANYNLARTEGNVTK